MTITSCGPVCDVGGEFILPIKAMLGLEPEGIHVFSVAGSPELHCCDDHLAALKEMGEKNDYTVLPEGPLRRSLADLFARDAERKAAKAGQP